MSKIKFYQELLFPNANFQNIWRALIIFIMSLLLTLAGVFYTSRVDETKEKNDLVLVGNEIRAKIMIRLHAHAQLLRAGAAFFFASDTVTRSEWKAFNEGAKIEKNLPGIQGLGFSVIIPKNQLQQHIQHICNEGFPDYTIKPSGKRDFYSSIIFLEPFSGRNMRAFGYDMLTEPTRRQAMEAARDNDVAMLSGKVTLVQETDKNVQIGTLMYVPVYRNGIPANTIKQRQAAIIGWVYSPYRMNDLMQGILGNWDLNYQARIHLQVYDSTVSANSLLYDSQTNDSLRHNNRLSVNLPLDFNGQIWMLSFTKSQDQATISSKILIVLGSGILISLLLFVLSLSLFNTYTQVKQKASELTTEIRVSEERFENLLNSTAEGIYGINLQGKCTFSNVACHQLLGYKNDEHLIGKNMHQLIHHSLADGSIIDETKCLIQTSFKQGEKAYSANEVFWRADGSCFPVEYWSNPVVINGKIEGSVVTFFDITMRIQDEKEILEAKNEAVKANHAKTEFLARMSHELRTPMNSILGFSQLMEMGELTAPHKTGVNHILTSGRYLLQLIDEILDITSIESGKLVLFAEPVNITYVIHEMIESIRPQILERQLTLEFENQAGDQLFAQADIKRFKQVLLNLLSNAIKYNQTNGLVLIKTEIMPESEGIVPMRISITNTGEAISSENIQKLFLPFERIGAERTEIKGTGLGLTVVKKLIVAMGGEVGVASKPGEGNTFWIELPTSEQPSISKGQHPKNEEPASTPMLADTEPGFQQESELQTSITFPQKTGTILYIEDNLLGIELVGSILRRYHPKIKLITTMLGENALIMAKDHLPDLILLDLNLPDLHGSKVLANLIADPSTSTIPVVIISTEALPEKIEELKQAGAKAYLTKPFNVVSLLKAVDECISNNSNTEL